MMSAFESVRQVARWRRLPPALVVLVLSALAACGGPGSASATPATLTATPTVTPADTAPAAPIGTGAPSASPIATGGSATATVPSPGSTLSTVTSIGATEVISNPAGDGFTVIHDLFNLGTNTDQSTLETYDDAGNELASLSAGQFTGDCGAADVLTPAGRLVITLLMTTTPARGVTPASYSITMTAWNAETGTAAWTDALVKNSAAQASCPASMNGVVDLWGLSTTQDGHWGVFPLSQFINGQSVDASDAIDLATGKLYPHPNIQGVVGNYVVTGSGDGGDGEPVTLTVTTPDGWPSLATVPGSGAQDVTGLQLQGGGNSAPSNFAPTGYTGNDGTPGEGIGAVGTPDGDYLIGVYTDGNGNSWYDGYSLPSLHQAWSAPVAEDNDDQIVGISNTQLLITRSTDGGDTYLVSLDPKTGQQQWRIDIGGGSACDLTAAQVLVEANSQLATLSAATGKQLSYGPDPYQDGSGDDICPTVVETGLGGTGFNNDQVTQLLMP